MTNWLIGLVAVLGMFCAVVTMSQGIQKIAKCRVNVARLFIDLRASPALQVFLLLGLSVVVLRSSATLSGAITLLGLTVIFTYANMQKIRKSANYERDLLSYLEAMSRSLNAGSGLLPAIKDSCDRSRSCGGDVKRLIERVNAGASINEALSQWAQHSRVAAVNLLSVSLSMSAEMGTSSTKAIDVVAAGLRASLTARDVANTQSAQAKTSALVLTLLPVLVLCPLLISNEGVQNFMLHTAAGALVLLTGLLLDIAGGLWMAWLIRRALT